MRFGDMSDWNLLMSEIESVGKLVARSALEFSKFGPPFLICVYFSNIKSNDPMISGGEMSIGPKLISAQWICVLHVS
jgi:hypothetical protein